MQAKNKEHIVLVLSSFFIPLSASFAAGNLKTSSLNASESRFYQPCSGVNIGCCLSKVTPSWGRSGNMVDLGVRTTPLVYPKLIVHTGWRCRVRSITAIMTCVMSEENWRKVTSMWNEESSLSFTNQTLPTCFQQVRDVHLYVCMHAERQTAAILIHN